MKNPKIKNLVKISNEGGGKNILKCTRSLHDLWFGWTAFPFSSPSETKLIQLKFMKCERFFPFYGFVIKHARCAQGWTVEEEKSFYVIILQLKWQRKNPFVRARKTRLNQYWFGAFLRPYSSSSDKLKALKLWNPLFSLKSRYMAIMNPLKPRMGKRATLCIAVSIWVSKGLTLILSLTKSYEMLTTIVNLLSHRIYWNIISSSYFLLACIALNRYLELCFRVPTFSSSQRGVLN